MAFEKDSKIVREIGTIVNDKLIKFVVHTDSVNQETIRNILNETFYRKFNIFWVVPSLKYGIGLELEFVEKKFSNKEIDNFTYYFFSPEASSNKYIFKYIEIGKGLDKLLTRNTFYFNKPQNFRDNTDCKYQIDTEASDQNILDFYYKKELEIFPNLDQKDFEKSFSIPSKEKFEKDLMEHHYNGVFSLLGITCFSERYDNKLMWDQYADGSKGVCLVFDTTVNTNARLYYSFCRKKVKYFNRPPKYFYDASGVMEIGHIAFAKTKDYKFENEIREMINFQYLGYENRVIKFDPRALKAIIFGPGTNKTQKERINSRFFGIPKYRDMELIESTLDNNLNLKLDPHKINLREKT